MKHRLRELDTARTFWQKLGVTIVLLILGVLLAPLFLMAPGLNPDPFANWIVKVAIDLIAGFYFVLLVYVWWRPKWLQRIYAEKEATLARLGFGLLILGGFLSARVVSRIGDVLSRGGAWND